MNRRVYHIENFAKFASSDSKYSAEEIIPHLNYEELKLFVELAPAEFFDSIGDFYLKRMIVPYLMIAGASENIWSSFFEDVNFNEKVYSIYQFICTFHHLNMEAFQKLEPIIAKYSLNSENCIESYFIDIYLKTFKNVLNTSEIISKISSLKFSGTDKIELCMFLIKSQQFNVVEEIFKVYTELFEIFYEKISRLAFEITNFCICRQDSFEFISALSFLSRISEPQMLLLSRNIHLALNILFNFYHLTSIDISNGEFIKLNCEPIKKIGDVLVLIYSGEKVLTRQTFKDPLSVTIPIYYICALIETIKCEDLRILENILQMFEDFGHRFYILKIISESFIIGALKDERFYNYLFERLGSHKLIFKFEDLLQVLESELPVDSIKGNFEIDFRDYSLLNQKSELERFFTISGLSCLDFYELICKNDSKLVENFSFHYPFIIYWIESDEWESIANTDFYYHLYLLKDEYPTKIAALRDMKNLKLKISK